MRPSLRDQRKTAVSADMAATGKSVRPSVTKVANALAARMVPTAIGLMVSRAERSAVSREASR